MKEKITRKFSIIEILVDKYRKLIDGVDKNGKSRESRQREC